MATFKRNALGRGLDALITMDEVKTEGSSSINEIELSRIYPNPDQPRREFDPDGLAELASSIRELRQTSDGSYQIIAGERRFRAATMAGLKSVPAYVRTAEDETMMEMALIENIQREDLNSIEIALTFQKLIEQYNLTQERLSERIGKKRTTIANYLRLLKLPAEIQMGLKNRRIDMGHARALLGIDDPATQLKIYEQIQEQGYSVRKVEELVKTLSEGESAESGAVPSKTKKIVREEYGILQKHLSSFFKTKVQFVCSDTGKGKISIPFKNEEELERLMAIFDQLK